MLLHRPSGDLFGRSQTRAGFRFTVHNKRRKSSGVSPASRAIAPMV
jgi:hypothetical protein